VADFLFECVAVFAPENFVLLGGQVGLNEGEFPAGGAFVEEHGDDLKIKKHYIR